MRRLGSVSLPLMATVLSSFNANTAIIFLTTLVPDLQPGLARGVVAGALAGGGLTVTANAPNPAGHAILKDHFPDGISPECP